MVYIETRKTFLIMTKSTDSIFFLCCMIFSTGVCAFLATLDKPQVGGAIVFGGMTVAFGVLMAAAKVMYELKPKKQEEEGGQEA